MAGADKSARRSRGQYVNYRSGGLWTFSNPRKPREPEPEDKRKGCIVAWRADAPELVFESEHEYSALRQRGKSA